VCTELDSGRGNSVAGYDNIGLGMLTVFQCTTQAGWAQVMYRIMDSGAEMAVPYFILLIFFGPYFVVNSEPETRNPDPRPQNPKP
jgi:hypothetical protein